MVATIAAIGIGAVGMIVVLLAAYGVFAAGENHVRGNGDMVNVNEVMEFDRAKNADKALTQDTNAAGQAQRQGLQNGNGNGGQGNQ